MDGALPHRAALNPHRGAAGLAWPISSPRRRVAAQKSKRSGPGRLEALLEADDGLRLDEDEAAREAFEAHAAWLQAFFDPAKNLTVEFESRENTAYLDQMARSLLYEDRRRWSQ